MRRKVVILGTRYASIFRAANLCRAKAVDVVLIDKNPYHLLIRQLPQVVSGEKVSDDIHLLSCRTVQ
jgi:NADH dehydrogenase FAD-containing subunit